jgi:hypothetical protein
MARISDAPLLTKVFSDWSEFTPLKGTAYIFGQSGEERSIHPPEWELALTDVQFVRVASEDIADITVLIDKTSLKIGLRSDDSFDQLFGRIGAAQLYIDITGLSHHVWASLLKAAVRNGKYLRAVYAEPEDYRFSSTPTEGEIFDLSERINGLAPLPGFTSLFESSREDAVCYVPLLGFEGTRLAYTLEQVQPPIEKVVPVVGVPGFRLEYPFHTYLGNKLPLTKSHIWRNVRYAIANCPFSLLYCLQGIAGNYPQDLLKVAPIGTKPHALGAVLYALSTKRPYELVYDHPIRKPSRTFGVGHLLVYEIGALELLTN